MKVLYGVKDPWYLHNIRTEQTFWNSLTYKVKFKRFMKKLKHVHKNILHNKKHGYSTKNLVLKEAILTEEFANLRQMYLKFDEQDTQGLKNEAKRSEQLYIENLLHRCVWKMVK